MLCPRRPLRRLPPNRTTTHHHHKRRHNSPHPHNLQATQPSSPARTPIHKPNPLSTFRLEASIMKTFVLLLWLSATGFAQEPACGLKSIKETTPLVYPPIAKAAHVEGLVIFLVSFKLSGDVESVQLLSGPKLLQSSATLYVKGLRANEYGGSRTCPMVVRYVLQADGTEPHPIDRTDVQHVTVYASNAIFIGTNDPAGKKIRHWWPFGSHTPKHLD
jgi:hypothetical protein